MSLQRWLENFRVRLSRPDAILPLSILGLIAGMFAAITIIALRLFVDFAQLTLLPMTTVGDFAEIPALLRALIAIFGGCLIGLLFLLTPGSTHTVGLVHIFERLAYHQGRLPFKSAVVQFIGGAISMITGHSVGREGPSAHLGAASSNLPAQALDLPNNSLRILAACGAAAGIAASFNTPLAGAAFAMEVLLMEYSVTGFAPVILATVSATALTRAVFGSSLTFSIPHLPPGSLIELPYILLCGVLIGILGAGFNHMFQYASSWRNKMPEWFAPVVAGIIVAACGFWVPEIMGMGDATVNSILLGHKGFTFLLLLIVFKMIATTGGIGLGLPGGIIGPMLFIGAASGALLNAAGVAIGITDAGSVGLYAMIGMGAMMAGTMQAPLAGLIAILELTGEPNFILPGMLAVVAATISCAYLTKHESLLQSLLRARGLDYSNDPLAQSLRRIGVAAVMSKKIEVMPVVASPEQVDEVLKKEPGWVLLREDESQDILLAAIDLARARKEIPDEESYLLKEIPGTRLETETIDMRATMHEAQNRIEEKGAQALIVISQTVPGLPRVLGVLTPDDIRASYKL
ncbi:MAG: chloride channel protein [Gammaproteobacteria bacterium]